MVTGIKKYFSILLQMLNKKIALFSHLFYFFIRIYRA